VASGAIALPVRASIARGRGAALLSNLTLASVSIAGVAAFLYPFLLSRAPGGNEAVARAGDAPLIFALLLSLALLLFVLELSRQGMNAKTVSMLAVVMVAPAGASAFDFLVIIGGYVFGARQGFLIGAGALFVSAFALGGFGPWLPFQMFACGWMGMTAGWLGLALQRPLRSHARVELGALAAFGALWGFLLGAILNLWFWPYMAQGESISWAPGMGAGEALRHYWSFYLLTSAGWDGWRAIADGGLILIAGRPVVDLLVRYRERFNVRWE
jgi:energy-coupling factor transport system substrate-specific component